MSQENAGNSGLGAAESPRNTDQLPVASTLTAKRPPFLAWLAIAVAALSLFAPLAASGIWDPPEREVAELGRRIALNLLGGHDLAVIGGNNEVPTRGELGR